MSEKLLPCPFCGGDARTFEYDGANQATCGGKHIDCAGTDVVAPVAMWNRRTPAPEGEASWIEPALVEHLRSLGCVCPKPLVGYRPNAGPRCRLCNVEPASPVVPVGSGERVRLIVSGLINGFTDFTVAEREAFIDRKTDAILAALRPTDTGRE
jgi:hypothetical protein